MIFRKLAATDETWRLVQSNEDVPFYVINNPPDVLASWTRILLESDSEAMDTGDGLTKIHCDRLAALRVLAMRHPQNPQEYFVTKGRDQSRQKEASSREGEGKQKLASKKPADPRLIRELQQELGGSDPGITQPPSRPLAESIFSGSKICYSASSKLNYILKEVRCANTEQVRGLQISRFWNILLMRSF